ncbi:uncharacterized protein LOC117176610 [Belonocnema kinseyi]|uniref:uncharacterized protein LOC117176610 n=1 Tax=Belonocnema kinseyi TaxID=2817044 RepID=UPI00143D7ED1|nr:uncharacterized protein LOC117176610 [Belonocnema kinseyi]
MMELIMEIRDFLISCNLQNYIEALKEKASFNTARAEINWDLVQDSSANRSIKWKFILPSAPHFGGLWEAHIKSAKSFIKKVIGTQNLTYEVFSTLTVEIEACMNSRPLLPLIGDLDDVNILTPGHVLIGRTLEQIPKPSNADADLKYVTHCRFAQAMRNRFWKRWSQEYLHMLQQRNKWTIPKRNYKIGDIVLIVDPSLIKHGTWPLGRITDVFLHRTALCILLP